VNKSLRKDLWKIYILGEKLRGNDLEYKNIPFEYRPILNRVGKIMSELARRTLKVLRENKEKERIKFAEKVSKIYRIILEENEKEVKSEKIGKF